MIVKNSKFKVQKSFLSVIPTDDKEWRALAVSSAESGLLSRDTWGEKIPRLRFAPLGMTLVIFGLVAITFHFALLTINWSIAHAASASNENFQLHIEEFDVPLEEQKPTPTPLPKPEAQGTLGIAFLPFEFSFALSEPFIDFGTLSATNPVTRATTLTVSSPGSGYQVFAYSNHVLLSKKNSSIPDTTCDNGSCSEITASLWGNSLTYGFGFRCDSQLQFICPDGFESENTYKQFSDKGRKEISQPIIQSSLKTDEHQAQITYRLNISGAQPKETYVNTVTYLAVPNF